MLEEQSGAGVEENEYEMSTKCNPAYEEIPANESPPPNQQSLSDSSECKQQSETSISQPTAAGSGEQDTYCTESVDEAATDQSQMD